VPTVVNVQGERRLPPAADLFPGSYLSLAQVAEAIPPGTRGRVSPSTIFRWVTKGVRLRDGSRLRLRTLRLGGRSVVAVEDLKEFIARQQPDQAGDAAPAIRSPAARRRASEAAAKLLEAAGL
jgi:Protein of unknown function (DUF1580)